LKSEFGKLTENSFATVISPGLFTTVQDEGRFGYRRYGVPPSGPLDPVSFRFANAMVENPLGSPALEILGGNLALRMLKDTTIGVAGALAEINVAKEKNQSPTIINIQRGVTVSIGIPVSGFVIYMAVRGGVNGDFVLNSYSTYVQGGFGGSGGRRLVEDDAIDLLYCSKVVQPSIPETLKIEEPARISIEIGPHTELLGTEVVRDYLETGFEVTMDSNRVGYRLRPQETKTLPILDQLVSFPVFPGMVQLFPNGDLLVILKDGQTTGGYPVVGILDEESVSKLAQVGPGGTVYLDLR
jgi:biotin-dependent carboxylase-like uncharacterized protein